MKLVLLSNKSTLLGWAVSALRDKHLSVWRTPLVHRAIVDVTAAIESTGHGCVLVGLGVRDGLILVTMDEGVVLGGWQ